MGHVIWKRSKYTKNNLHSFTFSRFLIELGLKIRLKLLLAVQCYIVIRGFIIRSILKASNEGRVYSILSKKKKEK